MIERKTQWNPNTQDNNMGTNYYLYDLADVTPPCPHCGRRDPPHDPLHIGKSSAGWCFSLHIIPEREIYSLDDWRREWSKPAREIRDEYGDVTPIAEMENTITNRSWNTPPTDNPMFYVDNHAEPGPRNLMRHRINKYCIAHGEGTWDLVVGEFL